MNSSLPLPASETARFAIMLDSDSPTVLVCDGTAEGILTCVFVAFSSASAVQDIVSGENVQPRIGQEVVRVPTSMALATRVQRFIARTAGRRGLRAVMAAAASSCPNAGWHIYRFIRHSSAERGASVCTDCNRKTTCSFSCSLLKSANVLAQITHPCVEPIIRMNTQVENEMEKMRNFVRFQHVEGDLWFAKCNPSCSVIPFVMGHFARRFNTQRFAIYDETHRIAGISEGGRWQLVATDGIDPPPASEDEAGAQDAWKRFYNALTIDARYNPELRRHFMPMRLWRNLVELTP